MTRTIELKEASIVSIVDGTIQIKQNENVVTYHNSTLKSANNGTIILEEEFPFYERGDILYNPKDDTVWILDKINAKGAYELGYTSSDTCCITSSVPWPIYFLCDSRKATQAEKERLFTEIQKEYKKSWNAKTLTWEDYIWKPEIGDIYWCIDRNSISQDFIVIPEVRIKGTREERIIQGNYFKTKEEADEAMAQIKEVLASYHK